MTTVMVKIKRRLPNHPADPKPLSGGHTLPIDFTDNFNRTCFTRNIIIEVANFSLFSVHFSFLLFGGTKIQTKSAKCKVKNCKLCWWNRPQDDTRTLSFLKH
jgi:hypothetical protein